MLVFVQFAVHVPLTIVFLLTTTSMAAIQAILERLCTTPQTKDTPPARGVPDKESGSDSRVPFRPGGTLNPGWKLTPDRAKSRAKSAESCSQQRSEIEIAEKLHGYGKVRMPSLPVSDCQKEMLRCCLVSLFLSSA